MNQHVTVAPTAPKTLSQLACETLAQHNGRVEPATDALTKKLLADIPLLRSLLQVIVRTAVDDRTYQHMLKQRSAVLRAIDGGRAAPARQAAAKATYQFKPRFSPEQREAAMTKTQEVLLDMIVWKNGPRLRDATCEQLIEHADYYNKSAATMAHNGRWLALIAKEVPPGQVVGDVLTEQRVAKLREEAAR